VAVATILFALGVPSYISYIRQSRRTEAKTALLDAAAREERFSQHQHPPPIRRAREPRVHRIRHSGRQRLLLL